MGQGACTTRILSALAAALALAAAAPAEAAPFPAEAFARLPKVAGGAVAPDGRHVAVRMEQDNRYITLVFGYDGQTFRAIRSFQEDDTYGVRWVEWVNAEDLLVSVRFAANRYGVATTETRLMAGKADDFKLKPLFRTDRNEMPVQIQDRIVSFLPRDPKHVLVQYYNQGNDWPSVFRVKSDSTRHSLVQGPRRGVLSWLADRDGDVRYGVGTKDEKTPYLTIRPKASKDWIDYSHLLLRADRLFEPVGFSSDPDILLVISNHDAEPAGLHQFDVPTGRFGDLIYRHPTADVSSVRFDPATGDIRGITVSGDEPTTIWLDKAAVRLRKDLSQALNAAAIGIIDQSPDRDYALFQATGPGRPGAVYLYDGPRRAARLLSPRYPELAATKLGPVFQTSYAARDGLTIPAFVTLPSPYGALDEARAIPFVLLPHGGPHARDYGGFDYLAQFIANLGYGVLQMNFRGSTGYGAAFEQAGAREWGEAMQDDITDGARWLIAQGYAAPQRLAILGGSYGGYAALMGAVKTPDLYQCAVSINGVTDLPDLLRSDLQYIGGRYFNRHIGNLWKDREKLKTNSPARNADKVRIPILLLHGEKDRVVPIAQSNRMSRALKGANKSVRYVKLDDGDHSLSLYENRLRALKEIEAFLGDCL